MDPYNAHASQKVLFNSLRKVQKPFLVQGLHKKRQRAGSGLQATLPTPALDKGLRAPWKLVKYSPVCCAGWGDSAGRPKWPRRNGWVKSLDADCVLKALSRVAFKGQ